MTSRSEFESGIAVIHLSWLCNELVTLSGQRVCRGLFCPVQLINPKIILPVGEGGELVNNVLYGKAPPPDLTPYTFIVEGARRVFQGWSLPIKNSMSLSYLHNPFSNQRSYNKSNFLEYQASLAPSTLSRLTCGKSRTSITQCTLFITIVLGWKVCQW